MPAPKGLHVGSPPPVTLSHGHSPKFDHPGGGNSSLSNDSLYGNSVIVKSTALPLTMISWMFPRLSFTFMVAVFSPTVVGVKVTTKPAISSTPRFTVSSIVVRVNWSASAPVMVISEGLIVSVPPPIFRMMKVCGSDDLPNCVAAKTKVSGIISKAGDISSICIVMVVSPLTTSDSTLYGL